VFFFYEDYLDFLGVLYHTNDDTKTKTTLAPAK